MKNTGILRIQTFAARQSAPVEGVTVAVQGYYAKTSANQPGIVFNEDEMLNKLAYFLADIDTESKAGQNSDGKVISVQDAVNDLTFYAKKSANQDPQWPDVVPSLKSLEGSIWYEG